MTMGPAPMIRMVLRSVLLGTVASGCRVGSGDDFGVAHGAGRNVELDAAVMGRELQAQGRARIAHELAGAARAEGRAHDDVFAEMGAELLVADDGHGGLVRLRR